MKKQFKTVTSNKLKISIIAISLICLLLGGYIGYTIATSPSTTFTISSGIYPGAPSYTIWVEDGNYFAKDANGFLMSDFSSSNFSSLIESCIANMPTYGGKILLKSGYYEGWVVIDHDGITLEGECIYSDIPEGIPDSSPTVLYGSVIKVTTADKDGIKITGQRFGIQIRNLGIWFTQSSTGCGIITDITQTYTVSHLIVHNIKILNCDKDSYAIRMANFLHCEVSMVAAWGGPLLDIYANYPDFHQGNSLFSELYGLIKYDLSPVTLVSGPYPIFIHRNDSVTTTLTNLLNVRRLQINNPTGCSDSDYWTFVCWNLGYSTLSDLDFEGSNLQNQTMRVGSCQQVTFINLYMWEMDPGDAYLAVASDNEYLTFEGCMLEKLADSNYTDAYINCRVVEEINSDTQAAFINLFNNSGIATLTSGQTSKTVGCRFIGPNDYVLLTIIDADALAAGEALKVSTRNVAPTNTFVVECIDEGTASVSITFYWQIVHATP